MTDHRSSPFDGTDADAADVAIDRAVREMMSGEPRPGFRQRVLARLVDEPRAAWSWARATLAASAVAIMVLIAIWARMDRPVVPAPTTPPQQAGPRMPVESVAPERPSPPPGPSAIVRQEKPVGVPGRDRGSRDRRVSAASVNLAEEALEPGAPARPPIDPMAIAPLQVRPLDTPELIVKPVAIGPLTIVPILPPR